MDTRRVYERHLTHTNDAHLRMLALVTKHTHNLLKAVTGSEEVRAIDLIHLHTLRNGKVFQITELEVTLLLSRIDLVANDLDICRLSHTTHEEQTGTEQTHFDGDGQVEDYRQQESYPQHDHIALGVLHDAQEASPTTHVIAHNDKYTCQTRHGDILCQWHQEQEDQQQHGSMYDTCHRRTSAIIDVCHRTGDGTRSRYTAKDRRCQVGHSLSDEFCVGVMTVTNHTISHSGRKQ